MCYILILISLGFPQHVFQFSMKSTKTYQPIYLCYRGNYTSSPSRLQGTGLGKLSSPVGLLSLSTHAWYGGSNARRRQRMNGEIQSKPTHRFHQRQKKFEGYKIHKENVKSNLPRGVVQSIINTLWLK